MAQSLPGVPAAIARTIACCNTHTLSSSARSRLARFSQSRPHPFSTTAPALSRGKKPSPGSGDRDAAPVAGKKSRDGGSGGGAEDPLDLSLLEAAIARTLDWLKRQIAEGRNGGKNAAAIEGLRVTMPKGGELKLGDVAQVMTRNRVLVVLVADKEHLKPIISTLNNSSNSLAPTASSTNPLELHVQIPPPTRQLRSVMVDAAAKHAESAGSSISIARAAHKKKLRALELKSRVPRDAVRKAGEEMEKVVVAGTAEVKRLVEGLRKGL